MTIFDKDSIGRRAVFLDIDGTYAYYGAVPAGHVSAVRRARAAGHLVFLCTGRPRAMVPPRILAAGFDGFVCGAGAYVEVRGRVLADVRFDPALAARTVAVLDSHDVAYLLEAPDAVHGPPGVDRRIARRLAPYLREQAIRDGGCGGGGAAGEEMSRDILAALRMSADHTMASFGKVTCFESRVPVSRLAAEIGSEVGAIPSSISDNGESAGELYLVGLHKAVGMRLVLSRLRLDREQSVAVGDSLNDVEMLREAGTAVAIEGAEPIVLAAADRVAAGPEREGLASLFAELALF